jgi:hypothetical protein
MYDNVEIFLKLIITIIIIVIFNGIEKRKDD